MRNRKSPRALRLALAAGIVLFAAACGGPSFKGASSGGAPGTHKGGTIILLANSNWGTMDPAKNYTVQEWQLLPITNDGLVTFKHANNSSQIVADLATSVPTPTDGGKTYTFKLRKGIRYSNGQPLRASDFVTVIKRQFTVPGPANSFYEGIIGATHCAKDPSGCNLSAGVVTDNKTGTVTFHLTAPDPEFLDKLALPFVYAVPRNTPLHGVGNTTLPGTGPYMWKYYKPNCCALLVRNPYFRAWSVAAQPPGNPDRILYKFGLPVESEVTEVENGQADWMFDQPPADRLTELGTKYASQTHISVTPAFYYMALNVNIPPFNNLKARQALNYGINRAAYVKIFGGPELATPSCQVLTPGLPGYKQYCPYTAHPAAGGFGPWRGADLAKARRLLAQSGEKGARVAVVGTTDDVGRAITQQFVSDMNKIGFNASVKLLSGGIQYPYVQNSDNHVQVAYSDWYQDYPAASDFLDVLFGCSYFHPGSDASPNESGFCDRSIQANMSQAYKLAENGNMTAANNLWSKVDQQVTRQAPLVSLFIPRVVNVVSRRVRGFQFSPLWYFLCDQAWVK
jgi:peptide/nickel transport system substrate-binding protein